MGRRPKSIGSSEIVTATELPARPESQTSAPARRGRKPKLSAIPAEVMEAPSGNNAGRDPIAARSTAADTEAPSGRRRPGPKPKHPVAAPVTALPRAEAGVKRGRKARASSQGLIDPASASDGGTTAVSSRTPTTSDSETGTGISLPEPSVTAGREAPRSVAQGLADPIQPAAHWDRATDTVRFDWAAIEQTASQEGPNQAMAKLLVAARAEGANSRWPL